MARATPREADCRAMMRLSLKYDATDTEAYARVVAEGIMLFRRFTAPARQAIIACCRYACAAHSAAFLSVRKNWDQTVSGGNPNMLKKLTLLLAGVVLALAVPAAAQVGK